MLKISCVAVLLCWVAVHAFVPSHRRREVVRRLFATKKKNSFLRPAAHQRQSHYVTTLYSKTDDSEDGEEDETSSKKPNPYQDENYPDLEFVDYSNPEYVVDQGVSDELFDPNDTDVEIEAMREERRRRNDEYQFETYFRDALQGGKEYKGEWTVYKTSTFLPESSQEVDANGLPRFRKAQRNLKVISRGHKVVIDPDAEWRVDGEVIRHEETAVPLSDSDAYRSSQDETIEAQEDGNDESASADSLMEELEQLTVEATKTQEEIMRNIYWPETMNSFDFRGQQGNMCVGNGYTICTAVPLVKSEVPTTDGPFSELRTELGVQSNDMRFRVKWDYRVKDHTDDFPLLHLKSMTVCREALGTWPRDGKPQSMENRVQADVLFGAPGAPGGLYDPPPVGSDEQAECYMLLDLDGGATVLFPYVLHQDPEAFDGNGWATSLDWTPGNIRYQVDRKVLGGTKLLGLRTLELSEVQGLDADKYRPRGGGQDMRQ